MCDRTGESDAKQFSRVDTKLWCWYSNMPLAELVAMPSHPCFRITDKDIDELAARTRDEALIDAYIRWMERAIELDAMILAITASFAGVQLGGGIGLLEADGMDNYAGNTELAELRRQDEKVDWRNIHIETLNDCYAAPSYFNARGFVFHLPAFLIAELNDQHQYGFIDRLIAIDRSPDGWRELLSAAQREAITATLSLIAEHPEYADQAPDIELAIRRLTDISNTAE